MHVMKKNHLLHVFDVFMQHNLLILTNVVSCNAGRKSKHQFHLCLLPDRIIILKTNYTLTLNSPHPNPKNKL